MYLCPRNCMWSMEVIALPHTQQLYSFLFLSAATPFKVLAGVAAAESPVVEAVKMEPEVVLPLTRAWPQVSLASGKTWGSLGGRGGDEG